MTESVWRTNEENKAYVAKLSWISNPLYLKKKKSLLFEFLQKLWTMIAQNIRNTDKRKTKQKVWRSLGFIYIFISILTKLDHTAQPALQLLFYHAPVKSFPIALFIY